MKFITTSLSFLIILICSVIYAEGKLSRQDYVKTYKGFAIESMRTHKIPASITLAQGILESGSGNSTLAKTSNNHFGIKCGGRWNGAKTYHDDDAKNECFRSYKSVLDSYNDHSEFLTVNSRYSALFLLDIKDYKGWAKGLSKAGYATNPNYANLLITIIEDLKLFTYDEVINMKPIHAYVGAKQKVLFINEIRVIHASKGSTYYQIAKRYGLTLRQIHKYNNTKFYNKESLLKEGDIVYLEPKRLRSKKSKFIELSKNKSLIEISNEEGVRLKKLMRKNGISSPNEQLRKGEKVFLR